MSVEKGTSKPEYTPEQKAKFVDVVCELYESQNATIESCCKAAGISVRSFHLWVGQFAEFAERYKKAKANQDAHYWQDIIRPLTKTSLQRLLEGEETQDTEVRDLSDKGILTGQQATTVKHSKTQPNATAVIFALKGLYPDMFADRQLVNMKVENMEGKTLTPDMIDEFERYLEAKQQSDNGISPIPGKSKRQ